MKAKMTITRETSVGIYDNCRDIARIYPDRTVATLAGVRWVGNTGAYHEYRYRLDGEPHRKILVAMADDAQALAWEIIVSAMR